MRRTLMVVLGTIFALTLSMQAALAASPHFVRGPDYTATTTALTASGKAAGLGMEPVTAFLTAEDVQVFFHCVNRGNNFAPGHPADFNDVTGPTQTITPRNGQITFDVSLPAPAVSATEECPNRNWQVIVDEVDYLGVTLHIQDAFGNDLLSDGPHDFTSCSAGFGGCVFTG